MKKIQTRINEELTRSRNRKVFLKNKIGRHIEKASDFERWVEHYPLRSFGIATVLGYVLGTARSENSSSTLSRSVRESSSQLIDLVRLGISSLLIDVFWETLNATLKSASPEEEIETDTLIH